jgi:hypothetical protein
MPVPDFSPGEVLTAAAMDSIGLWKITSANLTGVTNNFIGCFSSDYTNYLVTISGFNNATTTTRAVTIKLLSGSTPTSDSTYTTNEMLQYAAVNSGSSVPLSNSLQLTSLSNVTGSAGMSEIRIYNPNVAAPTSFSANSHTFQSNIAAWIVRTTGGVHNTATAYTGFQILGVTDNLSGTVTVYGYRK